MSALTEQVAREHRTDYDAHGWSCGCGHRYGQPADVAQAVQSHRLEEVEQAVRANVAAEPAEAWERGFMFGHGLDRGCTVAESHDLSPHWSLRSDLRIWNPYTDDTDEEDPYE